MSEEIRNLLDVAKFCCINLPKLDTVRTELAKIAPDIYKAAEEYAGLPKRSKNETIIKLRKELEEKLGKWAEQLRK